MVENMNYKDHAVNITLMSCAASENALISFNHNEIIEIHRINCLFANNTI